MPNLFDSAAERSALASGRPLSQELAEIKGAPALALPSDGLFVVEGERFDVIVDVRRIPKGGR